MARESFEEPAWAAALAAAEERSARADSEEVRRLAAGGRLLTRASALVFELAPDGAVLFANDALEAITGYHPLEVAGRSWWDVFYPGERRREGAAVAARLAAGDVSGLDTTIAGRGGEPVGLELTTANRYDERGALARVIAFGRDVTERNHAVEALRAAQLVLDQAAVAILWVRAADAAVTYANDAALRLLRRTRGELGSLRIFDFAVAVPPERWPEVQAEAEAKRAFAVETRFRRSDGELVPVELAINYLPIAGEPHHCVFARDISDRLAAEASLRASEERYRRIVETSVEGIWVVDASHRTTFANARLAEILGTTVEALAGTSPLEFVEGEWRERLSTALARRRAGVAEQHEFRYRRRDGRPVWALVSAAPLVDERGRYAGALAMMSDHTERRRAAEELAVRARQQEVVARLGCRALATADLDGAFASAVALVAETLDVELCRLVEASPDGERMAVRAGVGWREGCVGACLAPENRAFIRATLESGGPITFEDLAKEARFGPIPLLVEHGVVSGASAIVFGAEHRFGVLSAFSRRPRKFSADDLNFLQAIANVLGAAIERARSEVALRESEGRFRAVFENTLDAVLVADDDGVYVEANPAACALLGMPREELVGRRVAEIVDGDGGEARWQAFLAEGAARGVVAIRRADGKRRLVDFVARANVLPGRHISALRDVTEHETLERQLRQAQKMEAVGRLAGGVAHDFNNLLTAITGYSDLAVAALRPEDPLRRDLEEIRKAALRAAQLTRQLLAFSRKQVIEPRLMDLNSVLANLEPMLRRLIGEDIALEAKPGRCLSVVQADPGQVEQVIMNLVVNARDAMPDGGRLALETADVRLDEAHPLRPADLRPGAYVMLSVVDTGCGMDSATLSHIFEPFFTTKEQGKGTGLGLSTVYGIVKQAGGAVSVQSQPGQGSAFRIFFPAAQGEADPLEPRGATPVPARGTETVLLVEDEDLLRALAARTLQQHGYRVVEARHGGEALAIAEKHEGAIELLVTDVIMPQINGRELADRLRPSRPEMKVLFTSGYTPDEVLRRGVREGAANFIQKPFAPAAFARKVREVLDG